MMKVLFLFSYLLESTELATQILPYTILLPETISDDNPLVINSNENINMLQEKNWSSIIVNEALLTNMKGELALCDYSHVQFIMIQEQSLRSISKLIIQNLPELQFILTEELSFKNVNSFKLSCISYFLLIKRSSFSYYSNFQQLFI